MSLVSGFGAISHNSEQEWVVDNKMWIPSEIFEQILSYLSDMDRQSTLTVSRCWSIMTIHSAQLQIKLYVKTVAEFFNEKLNPSYVKQREKIISLGEIYHSVNLMNVNSEVSKLEHQTAKVLKDVKDNDVNEMSFGENKFVNIFNSIWIFKKIDKVNSLTDEEAKSSGLYTIAVNLQDEQRKTEWALEVSHSIPQEDMKTLALGHIIEKMRIEGKLDEALKVAETIPCVTLKSAARENILKDYPSDEEWTSASDEEWFSHED